MSNHLVKKANFAKLCKPNMDKESTHLEKSGKNSEIGCSFSNARSLVPLHFSSKDEELRTKKLLSTFLSPSFKKQQEDYFPNGKINFNF